MRAFCSICTDLFDEVNSLSVTPCGHVYHSNCLTLWISQSKKCPECRKPIARNNLLRLYINFSPPTSKTSSDLENDVINLKAQLSAKNIELLECRKEKDDTIAFVREAEKKASELQQTVYKYESDITELCLKLKSLSDLGPKVMKLQKMNEALNNDLQHLSNIQQIVNGTQKDADDIFRQYGSGPDAVKQMATCCTVLKRELTKVIGSKSKLLEQNAKLKKDTCQFVARLKFYENAMCLSNEGDIPVADFTKQKMLKVNNLMLSSTPASHEIKACSSAVLDTSPLDIPFNKLKFNMCVVSPSSSCKVSSDVKGNGKSNVPFSAMRESDENSIIRTGYNGLGGHSNFINITSGVKKFKNLKRKH